MKLDKINLGKISLIIIFGFFIFEGIFSNPKFGKIAGEVQYRENPEERKNLFIGDKFNIDTIKNYINSNLEEIKLNNLEIYYGNNHKKWYRGRYPGKRGSRVLITTNYFSGDDYVDQGDYGVYSIRGSGKCGGTFQGKCWTPGESKQIFFDELGNFKIKFLTTKDLYNKIKLPTTFSNNLQIDCNDGIRAQSLSGTELINPSPLFSNLENTYKLCKIIDLNSDKQLIAGFDVGHLKIQGDLKKAIESEWFQNSLNGNEEIVSTSSYVVEDFVKSETPIENSINIIDDYYKINKTINGNVKKYEFKHNQTFYYDNSSGFFIVSKNNNYNSFTKNLPNINLENQYTRFLSVRNYENTNQIISYEKPASSFSGNFENDEKHFPIYIIDYSDYSKYSYKPFTNKICLNSLKDSREKPDPISSHILKNNKVICDAENRKIYISSLAFDDNIDSYYLAQNIATTFIR